jgi:hypothetical protein
MKQCTIQGKEVDVIESANLYKWAKVWGKVQKNYYPKTVMLRREKQIEDFVLLNEFQSLYIVKDTDILQKLNSVDTPEQADLVIITDQKFSRLPCPAMINNIQELLLRCPRMYLCLNRHYVNIDNTFCDSTLSDHYPLAITQWLKKNLVSSRITDLSLDYLDCGDYFTWVVPDRMYYIENATS